ncbi:MAG: XrtA-associated tyrosine autokinase [Aquincola sp.]|nr:XrtA-associated tyrosine autokinase [Aquincola sp.]
MSIIEQATRRLEELKRAGVQVDWQPPEATHGTASAAGMAGAASAHSLPTPSARDRAAGSVAAHALVRVGLRQSKTVQIDLMGLAEQGYLVPGAPRSSLAEEMRAIKQPLLKHAREALSSQPGSIHANLIMLTSALPGEGKTFCALNLALSIASEVDSSVLLVDADVVRPAVMNRLGVAEHHKGLLDLLSDTSLELPEVILKTNVPKLSVLPAGAPTAHSTELLASDAMRELLHEMATRYPERIVIFDAPPLLSTTESRVLASRMGQLVMVVAAGSTPTLELQQAFTALEHCPLVHCLLNRTSSSSEQHRYGYYTG